MVEVLFVVVQNLCDVLGTRLPSERKVSLAPSFARLIQVLPLDTLLGILRLSSCFITPEVLRPIATVIFQSLNESIYSDLPHKQKKPHHVAARSSFLLLRCYHRHRLYCGIGGSGPKVKLIWIFLECHLAAAVFYSVTRLSVADEELTAGPQPLALKEVVYSIGGNKGTVINSLTNSSPLQGDCRRIN